jgi:hypothetical protein
MGRIALMRPRLFVELCCRMASVSLRLQGGPRSRALLPVSGSKAGYADAILAIMGLTPGQGADAIVLVDADEDVMRLWRLVLAGQAPAVAAIVRAWQAEEARALWDRLRAEPPPAEEPAAVARWLYLLSRRRRGLDDGGFVPEVRRGDPRRGPDCINGYSGGPPRGLLASRLEALSLPGAQAHRHDLEAGLPSCLPDDLTGAIVYLDPPYADATGYTHALSREAVLAVAREAAERGAAVYVSEAAPLDLPGWHPLEITATRTGQARTFSAQQAEWLTCSRPPAWRPAVQRSLLEVA